MGLSFAIRRFDFQTRKTFSPSVMSSQYPRRGDWVGHYGYALQALRQGDYEEAAQHFEFASVVSKSKSGTVRKVWEYEKLVSQLGLICLTDRSGIQACTWKIKQLGCAGPPSQRARYLESVLNERAHPSLDMALRNSLASR